MKRVSSIGLFLCFAAASAVLWAQQARLGGPAAAEAQAPPERLLKRIQEHYGYLQAQEWAKAEAYLTEESKEVYRKLPKGTLTGFRIGTVKMADNGQEAEAVILVRANFPGMAGVGPAGLEVPQGSIWKLREGEWYRDLKKEIGETPPPTTLFDPSALKPPPAPPEYLKFLGKTWRFGYVERGMPKLARFPFKNESNKTVRISRIDTRCPCLKAEGFKPEYKPGESGIIDIRFDSSTYLREYDQSILVYAEPDNQLYKLRVWAYIYAKDERPQYETLDPRPEQKKENKP